MSRRDKRRAGVGVVLLVVVVEDDDEEEEDDDDDDEACWEERLWYRLHSTKTFSRLHR